MPFGNDGVVIAIGPVTVTVKVTGGILIPLAVIVVVPAPTEFTCTRVMGELLPSQKKFTEGTTVATSGRLDVRLITMPSLGEKSGPPGTVCNSLRSRRICWPVPTIVVFGEAHSMVAPTLIVIGAGEVKPGADALMVPDPTLLPVACAVTVVPPAAMKALAGFTLIFGLLLVRVIVVP